MASKETLKRHARLVYRFFAIPEDRRKTQYNEFNRLCDQHRWHEAEMMVEKLEKTPRG